MKEDEQIVSLLQEILAELKLLNQKLNVFSEDGSYSLQDVCSRVDNVERAVYAASEGVDNVINLMGQK